MRTMLACCLCLLLPAVVWGNPAVDRPVRLRSVQAEFTQEKHLKILVRPLISHGVFAFQAPGSLRWEYLRPLHSILLMHNGKMQKLMERDGRFEQENGTGMDSMQIVLQDIGNWLDGRFTDNPMFIVSRGEDRIVLTPKEQGLQSIISRIELHPGQEQGVIERVTIVEGPDAFTTLTFRTPVLNREIPESTFTGP
jgi:outer membrane lipoprotein-sorting protein